MFITRIAFCEECAKHGRPSHTDTVVLFGSRRDGFFTKDVDVDVLIEHHRLGFVPHIIQFYQNREDKVEYESICAIIGCGVDVRPNPETAEHEIIFLRRTERKTVPIKDWNALVALKKTGYEVC